MAKEEKKDTKGKVSYGADDIVVLEGLEAVRKRPGMYIGTTSSQGLHHLIIEIFDNSRDEAMAGYANDIEIALLPGNYVRVTDNGRGIPVEVHKKTGVSTLETIMTTLHAGGKFGGGGYKVSGGLHGVGASVVNALSKELVAEVHRDGHVYTQTYVRGVKKAPVKKIGTTDRLGTVIMFSPDEEIFKDTEFKFEKIVEHMRQQAYLVKGLRITIIDARDTKEKIDLKDIFYVRDLGLSVPSMAFYFEGGLRSLVKFETKHLETVHKNIFYVEKELNGVMVELALQYVDDLTSRILPFANTIYNSEGGMHITGFKTALTRSLNSYAREAKILKEKDDNLSGEDVLEGLTAVVSVKLEEIQFEGQTKSKLGSVEARGAVDAVFSEAFSAFLEEKPDDARSIVNKVLLALRARKAAKAAKDSVLRKGALEGMTLPGKLADCQTKNMEEAELFIVEGESAGGSSKQGRDRRTQAILPLKGKILNVERARLDRMLASQEIRSIVVALGTAIGDTFDHSKLRYGKIIIATDADVDGAHIRTLLLTLFYRYFRPLFDMGNIYIATPPLYRLNKGKEVVYVYSDKEKEVQFKKWGVVEFEENESEDAEGMQDMTDGNEEAIAEEVAKKKTNKVGTQRFKGLGEMDAEELWETTMNPAKRVLKKVTVDDARDADKVFDILMGEDVPSRKAFIQSNAKVANIDL